MGLLTRLVGTMAKETAIRKNRPHVTIEVDFVGLCDAYNEEQTDCEKTIETFHEGLIFDVSLWCPRHLAGQLDPFGPTT